MAGESFVPHYSVVTIFPGMFSAISGYGVTGRAFKSGVCRLSVHNLRDYSSDIRKQVDDRPFGGGSGMVITPGPLSLALRAAQESTGCTEAPIVYLTPQGRKFNHSMCLRFSQLSSVVFLCGRYEGIDQRIIDRYVTEEVSIGDYILTGGDLAVMVVLDAVVRLLPGSLGDPDSVRHESFS
uniref:tRNA (guanine(37)-N(1))-methyltransferase n=2 Tax=Candidatus Ichthyocystis TaxID=2929841 RepID=UPI000AE8D8CD